MRPERSSSDASAQAADPPSVPPRQSSYLRVGEAAEILQVSPKTVCRWAMDPERAIRELAASLQVQPS